MVGDDESKEKLLMIKTNKKLDSQFIITLGGRRMLALTMKCKSSHFHACTQVYAQYFKT